MLPQLLFNSAFGCTDGVAYIGTAYRASGGHIFSVMAEKIWKKRPVRREIALTRKNACRFYGSFIVGSPVKERPAGGASNQFDLEYRSAVNI